MATRMNKRQRQIFEETKESFYDYSDMELREEIRSRSEKLECMSQDIDRLNAEILALKDILEDRGDELNEDENFDQDLPTVESLF